MRLSRKGLKELVLMYSCIIYQALCKSVIKASQCLDGRYYAPFIEEEKEEAWTHSVIGPQSQGEMWYKNKSTAALLLIHALNPP